MVGDQRGFCSLLTREENEQVTRLLGHLCQSLATTVVQLFKTSVPDHTTWQKHSVGVLCLVKDSQRRSYYFRLYCLVRNLLIWEHEVYSNMDYVAAKPFFHLFEAEGCIIGFNFAVEDEARALHAILLEKMDARRRRRMERQSRHQQAGHASTLPPRMGHAPSFNSGSQNSIFNGSKNSFAMESRTLRPSKEKDKRGKGRNLTKNDISLPSNFRHLTHIGWDPIAGFALDNVDDPQLQQFFEEAGVSSKALKNLKTRKFIYDFIQENGGLDRVKNEVKEAYSQPPNDGVPPPVPVRTVPPSSTRAAPPPPPPPSRTGTLPHPPTPSHQHQPSRSPGLPPPPRIRAAPVDPPRHYGSSNSPQSFAPKQSSAMPPPPPPPPPPPSLTPPPPPTSHIPPPPCPPPPFSDAAPPPPPQPAVPDTRSALMEAIRSGATLKKVDASERNRGSAAPQTDSRAMLLDQIRQGKELRAVVPTTRPPPQMAQTGSLASALARALAERSKAIHSDSSDEESGVDGGDDDDDDVDDDDDDDDWDD